MVKTLIILTLNYESGNVAIFTLESARERDKELLLDDILPEQVLSIYIFESKI